jgi:hypothetical protein
VTTFTWAEATQAGVGRLTLPREQLAHRASHRRKDSCSSHLQSVGRARTISVSAVFRA